MKLFWVSTLGVCGLGLAEGPAGSQFHSTGAVGAQLPTASPVLPRLPPAHHFAHSSSTPTTPKAISSPPLGSLPPLPFWRVCFSLVQAATLGYALHGKSLPPFRGMRHWQNQLPHVSWEANQQIATCEHGEGVSAEL